MSFFNKYAVCMFFVVGLLSSCSNSKMKTNNQRAENPSSIKENLNWIEGVITTEFAKDGCALLIKTKENDTYMYLNPLTIPEEFKNEGTFVKFTYTLSRRAQTTCFKGKPITLERIEKR